MRYTAATHVGGDYAQERVHQVTCKENRERDEREEQLLLPLRASTERRSKVNFFAEGVQQTRRRPLAPSKQHVPCASCHCRQRIGKHRAH